MLTDRDAQVELGTPGGGWRTVLFRAGGRQWGNRRRRNRIMIFGRRMTGTSSFQGRQGRGSAASKSSSVRGSMATLCKTDAYRATQSLGLPLAPRWQHVAIARRFD